jgi:hypothetical protein
MVGLFFLFLAIKKILSHASLTYRFGILIGNIPFKIDAD